MFSHPFDCNPGIDVSVEHCTYQVNAIVAHHVWDAELPVHDFVDAVERVLFVDYSVEKYAKGPDILLFATVRLSGQYFGCRIIWKKVSITLVKKRK